MTQWFVYEWGKPTLQKPPPGDYKVTTSENLLLSQQAVTSKGILVSYTNLQLNSYPNTQLDLFCSDNLSFQCMAPSTWLTNYADPSSRLNHQLEKNVGCKIFQFITWWRSKTPWSQNPTVYKHSSFFKRKMNYGKFCLQSQFAWTRLRFTLVQLCSCATSLTFFGP